MSVMSGIRGFTVPRNAVAIWWLGQNGFIFKTSEGTLLSTDLYLTDNCATVLPDIGLDVRRQVPVFIAPDELDVDCYVCTHNHADHTDPATIRGLRNKDTMQFIGPHPSCDIYRQEGVDSGRIVPAWPQCELEFRDIHIRGTFALPTDDTDLNHMGYVFTFGKGPRLYMTGDTDASELLASAGKYSPDLAITCINGGFNNLSHWEAAELMGKIKPKAAIPCHYDMFKDNAVDPKQFRASLKLRAPGVGYQELEHAKPWVFSL
jgi:L-ascorbate 6-phosphate lactonase